jgi:hypothetical protein
MRTQIQNELALSLFLSAADPYQPAGPINDSTHPNRAIPDW